MKSWVRSPILDFFVLAPGLLSCMFRKWQTTHWNGHMMWSPSRARRNLSGSSVSSCSDPLGRRHPNHLRGGPGTDPSGPDRNTLRATLPDRLAYSFLASQVLHKLPRSPGKTSAPKDWQGSLEASLTGVSRTHQGLLCKGGQMSVTGTGSCYNSQHLSPASVRPVPVVVGQPCPGQHSEPPYRLFPEGRPLCNGSDPCSSFPDAFILLHTIRHALRQFGLI
jgi:hypothetical protein